MLTVFFIAVGSALIISAACSLFESVLLSLSPLQVEMMTESHPARAETLKQFKEHIDQPITAILTLNTLAHTIGASVAGAAASVLFGQQGLIWFSLAFTLAILLFTEILPKTLGVNYSRQVAPHIVPPLRLMIVVLGPLIWLARLMTRLVPSSSRSQYFGRGTDHHRQHEPQIRGDRGGPGEGDRQHPATGQQDRPPGHDPRTVTFSVPQALTIREAARMEGKWRMHSRVPVYDDEPDNVVGIVLSQDVLMAAAIGQNNLKLSQLMRPVHFVPETAPLDRIFIDFFERYQHLFVVVDEYGSVTGVISMEDVLEEIIGREIVDESDKARNMRELARLRKEKIHTL